MAVTEPDVVDFISTTVDGFVELTIADHLEWDHQNEHLVLLENKIAAYLDFVESGQLEQNYPAALNRKVIFGIEVQFAPDEHGEIFLSNVKSFLESKGFGFRLQVQHR